jgi:hypothetical protein
MDASVGIIMGHKCKNGSGHYFQPTRERGVEAIEIISDPVARWQRGENAPIKSNSSTKSNTPRCPADFPLRGALSAGAHRDLGSL